MIGLVPGVSLAATAAPRTALLVHVMPWFSTPPRTAEFGWHWTMGKADAANGHLASHFRPLGGAYDSADPDVVERQTLLMRIAGFDGLLVDWYGDRDRYDYLPNHRATEALFEGAKRAKLSFALVYEDQTVPQLLAGGVFPKEDATAEGKALLARAKARWFSSPTYQRVGGKPLFLVFGPQFYADDAWREMLPDVAFYTLHHRRAGAIGAYDWPLPGPRWAERRRELAPEISIPVAFPRFRDFYKEAGLHDSYGEIPDAEGKTYASTLDEALASGAPVAQVATWNDWGEGTQIEPSEAFGYRDLETTQRARRARDRAFPYRAADLRLPARIYALRRKRANAAKLDAVASAVVAGRMKDAKRILKALE